MIKWLAIAFNAWEIYSNLKFKRLFDPSADIIVAFGSGYHGDRYILKYLLHFLKQFLIMKLSFIISYRFDGPGNILAHAFYPYEDNEFGGNSLTFQVELINLRIFF